MSGCRCPGECLGNRPSLAACLCVGVKGVNIGEVSTGIGASQHQVQILGLLLSV